MGDLQMREVQEGEKMIDFKEFNKNEVIFAAEKLLEFNLLPSMEEHISRMLNKMKFQRLTDARNDIAIKINRLLDEKESASRNIKITGLVVKLRPADDARDKQLQKMLDLKIITQEEFNDLSLKDK